MVLPLPSCQIQERFVFFYTARPSDGDDKRRRGRKRRRRTRHEIRVGTMKKTPVRRALDRDRHHRERAHIWFPAGYLIKKEKKKEERHRKNNERNPPPDLERLSKMTALLCIQRKRFNQLFMNIISVNNPAIIFV